MSVLSEHWNDILSVAVNTPLEEPMKAEGFLRSWNSAAENMHMIVKGLEICKPVNCIELGTFEGIGLVTIANTLKRILPSSFFLTIDAGFPFDINTTPPTFFDWEKDEHWKGWGDVLSARNERVSRGYGSCKVVYKEGLARDILPIELPKMEWWDFCFHDTVHVYERIMEEWPTLKAYSKIGSLIVFDDVKADSEIKNHFEEKEPDWYMKYTETGHEQLWAERVR